MKKVLYSLLITGFLINLSACTRNGIVGTWEETEGSYTDARWVFYDDNTFLLEPQLNVFNMRTIGTYRIKGHTIYFHTTGGEDNEMHYKRRGNHLKLGTDAGGYYELTKVD